MTNESTQTQEQYASFNDRMLKSHGQLLGAAMRVALALKEKTAVPSDHRVRVDTILAQYRADDDQRRAKGEDQLWPATQGDLISLCLGGMLRKPDSKVTDALRQIEHEKDGVQAIYRRNRGKKIEDWPREDAETVYRFEIEKDKLVDPVDLGPWVAGVIFGSQTGNQVRAFAHLRREAGITRSCFFKQGAGDSEHVTRDFLFARRTQQSVRALLAMAGMEAEEQETVATEEDVDPLLAELNAAAQRDRNRQTGGTNEWATRVLTAWLNGKQTHVEDEDHEKIEAIEALQAEIRRLDDQISVYVADQKVMGSDAAKAAMQMQIDGLAQLKEEKETELAALQGGINEASVLESATPAGTGPMPGNTPVVNVSDDGSGIKLPETLAEVVEKLARLMQEHEQTIVAADRHYQDAQKLYEEADTLRAAGNRKEAGKKDVAAVDLEELAVRARGNAWKIQERIDALVQKKSELEAEQNTDTGETESTVAATDVAEGGETTQAGGSTELPTRKQMLDLIKETEILGDPDKKSLRTLVLQGNIAEAFAQFTELTTPVEVAETTEEVTAEVVVEVPMSEFDQFVAEVTAAQIDEELKPLLIEQAQTDLAGAKEAFADVRA